jgi:hypothetical protein
MKTKKIPTPDGWEHLEYHPLADLVEFGAGINVDDLADSMRDRGYDQQESIVLFEGKILDGRHRHVACLFAGVTPTFRKFVGPSAKDYVHKKLDRQHLSTSQRAMLAVAILRYLRLGSSAEAQNCASADTEGGLSEAQNCASADLKDDLSTVAERLKVSERSADFAAKVHRNGTTKLKEAVTGGTITVSDAATISDLSPEAQNKALADVQAGKVKTLKEAADIAPAVDAEGVVIPLQAVEAFAEAKVISTICREIDDILRRVEVIAKGPGGRLLSIETIRQKLKDAKGNLWANRPTNVCPYCLGKKSDCACCKGQGWTAQHVWHQAPGKNEKAKR